VKTRLDAAVTALGLAPTRSQAESVIKLGEVTVNGQVITKPGYFVTDPTSISMLEKERYVSRAGLKLASVAELLKLDFKDTTVLDVGSSTGGFTDYSLKHGASKVFAVDVGTEQLHPSLRRDKRIELHEKTDIRDFRISSKPGRDPVMPNIIVIDVSFISLRDILPHIARELSDVNTKIVAMVKPQFEAGKGQTNKGIIKNDAMRRQILKDFELWSKDYFFIVDKRDSDVSGAKGNQERFYLLKTLS